MLSRRLLRAALAAAPLGLLALTVPARVRRPGRFRLRPVRGQAAGPRPARRLADQQGPGGDGGGDLRGGSTRRRRAWPGWSAQPARPFGNVAKDNNTGGTVFAAAVAGRGPGSSNPAGTLGLAPEARILSIKVPHHASYVTWQREIADAIRYAAGHGAKVIYVLRGVGHGRRHAGQRGRVRGVPRRRADQPGVPGQPPSAGTSSPSRPACPACWAPARCRCPACPSRRGTSPPWPTNPSWSPARPTRSPCPGRWARDTRCSTSLATGAWLTATVALIKWSTRTCRPAWSTWPSPGRPVITRGPLVDRRSASG